MCLDANTGKMVWEYKFNLFQSDVPPHRVGWASPAADPETGNVYALSVGALVIALSHDGKLLWQRSVGEEFAAFTTHGGRTASPLIDGDLVIVSARRVQLGRARGAPAPVHRARQAHRRDRLRRVARRPAVRHELLGAAHRHDQRPAAAHLRQRRRRRARDQAADRREGLELRRRQARHQHRRGRQRDQRHRLARRREPRHVADGHDRRDRRLADGRHQDDEVGDEGDRVRVLVARSSTGNRLYQIDNGAVLHAFDVETGNMLWEHRSGPARRRRSCWPTASSTSAPRTAGSSSSGLRPTRPRC